MRKMSKGPAIAGGVLCIISVLASVMTLVNYSRMNVPASGYITPVINMLTTLLLGIALFRGKADAFAGVVCLLSAPMALWAAVSNAVSIPAILVVGTPARAVFSGVSALASLVKIAALVLMAVQCFRKQGGKSAACVLAAVAAAVLSVIATIGINVTAYAPYIESWGMDAMVMGTIVGICIGALFGVLPLILAGAAIGGSKPMDAAAPYVPQYGYPQQNWQYQQNAQYQQNWQQPQYQQPQQNWQQPQYQQPQQNWQQPQYQQPQQNWQQPQYQQYQAPQQDEQNEQNI